MKTTSIILALFAAACTSANILPRADTTSSIAPTTTSFSLSPTASCIAACQAGDVMCEAACVGSAHPNSLQANQTDECVSKCPQGDGSSSAIQNYGNCVEGCIQSYYPTSQTVGPVSVGSGSVTSVSAGATTSPSASHTGSGTATTGSSATSSGSAAASTSSKAAAANNGPYIASAGSLAGLFVAFLAL